MQSARTSSKRGGPPGWRPPFPFRDPRLRHCAFFILAAIMSLAPVGGLHDAGCKWLNGVGRMIDLTQPIDIALAARYVAGAMLEPIAAMILLSLIACVGAWPAAYARRIAFAASATIAGFQTGWMLFVWHGGPNAYARIEPWAFVIHDTGMWIAETMQFVLAASLGTRAVLIFIEMLFDPRL